MQRIVIIVLVIHCLLAAKAVANTWLVSETRVTCQDTIFLTSYYYNEHLQPILITVKKSIHNSAFTNYQYTENSYSNQNKISSSTYSWATNKWEKASKTEWTYTNNLLIEEKDLKPINNVWNNQSRINYTYDAWGNLTSETTQMYVKTWQNYLKNTYSYDTDSMLTLTFWQIKSNQWVNYGKMEVNGTSPLQYYTYQEFDSVYNPVFRTIYYNNATGNPLEEIHQIYSNNTWSNATKRQLSYNQNIQIESETYQEWVVQYWGNLLRKTYQEFDNSISRLTYVPLYNAWWPANKTTTTLNSDNLQASIETEFLFWGGDTENMRNDFLPVIINENELFIYGNTITIKYESHDNDGENTINNPTTIIVYPNPSKDGLFYLNIDNDSISGFQIFNLQGQLIKGVTNLNSRIIDISELNNGIYLSKIILNDSTFTLKLIKSH